MNRKQTVIAGGILSCTLLLYCVAFGPLVYAISLAAKYHMAPTWLFTPYTIVFRPHLWAMYESESYHSYVSWFGELGGGSRMTDWKDYRNGYEHRFISDR